MTADELLHALTAVPTAPFFEFAVLAFVKQWAKERKFRVATDGVGNMLVSRPTRSKKPRLVLVAHADHPGFIAEEMTDGRTLRARFHGYVKADFFVGSRVRFFAGKTEITGRVTTVDADDTNRPIAATLRVSGKIPAGTPGMWDVGGPRVRGHKFHCRVCDDLTGLAAALAALNATTTDAAPTAVLITRAEEEGFIGAIAAMQSGILRLTDRLVSIENSAEQPYAKQGDGMIVRVGDRTSIFNSAFTRFISTRADALAKIDESFRYQRALMPGGSCEATVFDAFDYVAAAVCVPLGNYHNMDAFAGKIVAENIDLRDWHSLVKLLTDLCDTHADFTGGHGDLKTALSARYERWARFLSE